MTDVEYPGAPLSPTDRSTIRRGKQRAATERGALYEVLDAGLLCHLGVSTDSGPLVLPTCYGRDGDTLYLHGSTGAASLRSLAAGGPACVTVTHLDGVVYARSVFHHSANYRSAVIQGSAVVLTDDTERLHGLRVMTENLAPGSWEESRPPTARELAATIVLAMDLHEASVKVRTGPPVDDDEDVAAGEHWAGVLPLSQVWGAPQPCPLLPSDTVVPERVSQR
ncbi:pyridoxamine 5'-phosphate oxidase family protein [Actinoalloteichus hymeniacidonis]|uniref:Flavin-nucleotide-binding protein n=1 Tax=Actinoalloteichus hymeniacidonis TaxID=340345 RepID=A0AAC9HTF9_9PSEU|nr:pyridoxamine 5'-phosphate oxidase family protein [Actinoalloteichus hymeniacidonis]AOS65302.1 putative flavin-nucleotide-binding protein [Actinoalloteichus hymeniacidonis]MBB5906613.1 hypothetical protein [Actinoalloteichus hymeniacidonis]